MTRDGEPRQGARVGVPAARGPLARLALELVGLLGVEVATGFATAALCGADAEAALGPAAALALAGAVSIAAVAIALAFLARVGRVTTPAQFPRTRAVSWVLAAPMLLALVRPAIAAWAASVIAPEGIGVALAVAIAAMAPVEARTRVAVEACLARFSELPAGDLPPIVRLPGRAALAAAPAIAVALVAIEIARDVPFVWLALAPSALAAGLAVRDARAAPRAAAPVGSGPASTEPPSTGAGSARAFRPPETLVAPGTDASRADVVGRPAHGQSDARMRLRSLAAMGHELRSPLNAIVGFAQLLEDGADGSLASAQLESVRLLRRSAQELLRLLTDVLDSAKLDAQRLRLERRWTAAIEIVTEAVQQGKRVVDGQDIAIDVEVQPGLPPMYVDRARIVQAVVAAFRHAVRSKQKGRIEIRAKLDHDRDDRPMLRVEVRDPDRTIAADELTRAFDALTDLRDATTGRRIGGLGLALALARNLARLHGGEVWAQSEPGQGTRYVVELPVEP